MNAGSERQSKTGAVGVMLAEGSQINKSLSESMRVLLLFCTYSADAWTDALENQRLELGAGHRAD